MEDVCLCVLRLPGTITPIVYFLICAIFIIVRWAMWLVFLTAGKEVLQIL